MPLDDRIRDDPEPLVAVRWDAEYRAGRYVGEKPVPFVHDILAAAANSKLPAACGLYIGCGNGRNYLPLVAGGLDLIGLDVSGAALEQLATRVPEHAADLLHGDVSSLAHGELFSIVVGIQVFQHGRERETHAHIAEAARRVAPGGLFCIRVNAAGTDIAYAHEIVERNGEGGFTIKYLRGPKVGLHIHFFGRDELTRLLSPFRPVLPLRVHSTQREPPGTGRWLQWEGIYRREGVHESSRCDRS